MSPKKKQVTPRKTGPWGIQSKSPISKPVAKTEVSPIKARALDFSILEKNANKSWLEMMEEDGSDQKTCEFTITSEEVTTTVKTEIKMEDDQVVEEETIEISKKTRKATAPKKNDPVPKFQKSLEQYTGMLLNRRSKRLKAKKVDIRDVGVEAQIEALRAEAAKEGYDIPEIDYKAISIKNEVIMEDSESSELLAGSSNRKRRLSTTSTATTDTTSANRGVPKKSARMYTPSREVPSRTSSQHEHSSSRCTSAQSTPSRRRLEFNTPVQSPNPREGWETPKQGWCHDEKVLTRRTKEIEMAKEKDVYKRYVTEVPKYERKKGIHPKTPNKFIGYSRRSWDAQVRAWKRSLYVWAGQSPSASVMGSISGSEVDEEDLKQREIDENAPNVLIAEAIEKIYTPDQMASLIGHFDFQTRDESTLKAPGNANTQGPVDFSGFKA